MKKSIYILLMLILLVIMPLSAKGTQEQQSSDTELSGQGAEADKSVEYFPDKITLQYTEGFSVEYKDNYKVVSVNSAVPNSDDVFQYILVQRGTETPKGYDSAQIIEVPVESAVTMSTTYLPYFEMMELTEYLTGHDSFMYIYSPAILARAAEGKMKEVGSGAAVNIEVLIDLEPGIIMTSSSGVSEYDAHPKLLEAGLNVVLNGELYEKTALGRTEWIKFIALFFNKEAEAEALFDKIAGEYIKLSALVSGSETRPTVLANAPWQGTWYMPGGKSYMTDFYNAAGAEYLWADDDSTGTLYLDFESVFEKAQNADYWVSTSWNSLDEAKNTDERFVEFNAFQAKNIFNMNARVNENYSNDYWESGPANPHLVLSDFIKVFHPELMPDYEFHYFSRLD